MVKWLRATILVALFALVALLSSPAWLHPYHQPKSHNETGATQQEGEQPESLWKGMTEDPVALPTLGLFIVTFILSAATVGLAVSTRRAARAAEQAARHIPTVERAYIFAGPTNIRTDEMREGVSVQILVNNFGKTPGIITLVYAEFSQSPPTGDIPRYENGDSRVLDVVINSSIGLSPETKFILPVIFEDDFADPQFFWGYIDYTDIFKKPHTSRFCVIIYPGNGTWNFAGSRAWSDWT